MSCRKPSPRRILELADVLNRLPYREMVIFSDAVGVAPAKLIEWANVTAPESASDDDN